MKIINAFLVMSMLYIGSSDIYCMQDPEKPFCGVTCDLDCYTTSDIEVANEVQRCLSEFQASIAERAKPVFEITELEKEMLEKYYSAVTKLHRPIFAGGLVEFAKDGSAVRFDIKFHGKIGSVNQDERDVLVSSWTGGKDANKNIFCSSSTVGGDL